MGFYGPILFHPIDVRLVAADRVKFSLNVLTRQLYMYIYSNYIESIASAYILEQVLFKRIALGMKYFPEQNKNDEAPSCSYIPPWNSNTHRTPADH